MRIGLLRVSRAEAQFLQWSTSVWWPYGRPYP
jgi:hypothetical protein